MKFRLSKSGYFKTLLISVLFSFEVFGGNNLNLKWYGTTCLTISDGNTTLLFDPFVTRVSLFDFVSLKPVMSDPELVQKWLGEDLKKTKAIFVSHTHYDHAFDLVNAALISESRLYGSSSMKNIVLGGEVSPDRIQIVSVGNEIHIGKFKIKILNAFHPPHFLGFILSSGKMERPIPLDTWPINYLMGESFNYFIEHPKGKILFHPTPIPFKDLRKDVHYKSDIVLMGIAKRNSDEEIIEKIIKPSHAKVFIPLHYDNFFLPLNEGVNELFLARLNEFKKNLMVTLKEIQLELLDYGKIFTLK